MAVPHVRLCASSICQLRCPVCVGWGIREKVGGGFLKFRDFRKFVDFNPGVRRIELSYGGEMFLNPELACIIRYACERDVALQACLGANFNHATGEVIEALVKYRFLQIDVSIDGASEDTYARYRQGGSFAKVMENVRKLNRCKAGQGSELPRLVWQFIVFGHNEHELPVARKMAGELGMAFRAVFNSSPGYSPVRDREFVSRAMGYPSVAAWKEAQGDYGGRHLGVCENLWNEPQINWDGRLLGCPCNCDFFPVNVFESGLDKALAHESYIYAKKMVLGRADPRDDVPCSICEIYRYRRSHGLYLDEKEVEPPTPE